MKTAKRFILCFYALFLGMGLVSSMPTQKSYNPCEFAYNNITYIKEQTENAIDVDELKLAKYYAYKALDGIWNAQFSFQKCGCDDALTSVDLANTNLKEATKSDNLEDSKTFLQLAFENTQNSLNAISVYREHDSKYADDVLVMNTKEAIESKKLSKWLDDASLEKIEQSLDDYKKSLENVIQLNDCQRAIDFIIETQQRTKLSLRNPEISQRKQYFHYRVLEITDKIVSGMESCPTEQLLARK